MTSWGPLTVIFPHRLVACPSGLISGGAPSQGRLDRGSRVCFKSVMTFTWSPKLSLDGPLWQTFSEITNSSTCLGVWGCECEHLHVKRLTEWFKNTIFLSCLFALTFFPHFEFMLSSFPWKACCFCVLGLLFLPFIGRHIFLHWIVFPVPSLSTWDQFADAMYNGYKARSQDISRCKSEAVPIYISRLSDLTLNLSFLASPIQDTLLQDAITVKCW